MLKYVEFYFIRFLSADVLHFILTKILKLFTVQLSNSVFGKRLDLCV